LFDYNYKVCADYDGKSAKNRPEYNDGCDSGYVACGGADGTFQFCAETSAGCPVTDFLIDYEDADLMAEADEATMGYHDGVGQLYLYTKKGGAFQTVEVGARVDPLAANFFSSQSILGFPLIDVVVQAYVPCYGAGTGHSGRGAEYDGFANAAEQAFDTGATCTDYSYSYYTGYFGYPGAYYQGYVQRSQQTGCSAQADTRYRAAYYASEQALFSPYTATYTSGDVVDYIPSQYLTADDSFMYYMAWQTETQWNEDTTSECPNRQTVIRNEEEVNNLYSAQLALIVLTIISFLIIGFVGAIANFVWIGNDDDGRIGEGEPHYDHLQWMKYGKWALKIGMYTCTIITIVYAFGVVDMFIEVSDGLDCTDSLSINTFTSLGDIVEELASKDVVVGVMNSADGISDGFGSVIGCL
jgi:hypothetical protein